MNTIGKIQDNDEIDVGELVHALMSHIVVILATTVCGALLGFLVSRFILKPEYTAGIKVYVNNSGTEGKKDTTISSAELTAAKSLVDTYMVILKMRSTLEQVAEEAGLPYTTEELKDRIGAKAINATEIFEINVKDHSAENAERIANAIAEILPGSISRVVDGASVKIIEYAELPEEPSAPIHKRNILLCSFAAFLLSCVYFTVCFYQDTQIHSDEYLRENYDIPVLGVIPDLSKK